MLFSAFDSFDPSLVAAVRAAFPGVSVMGSTSAAEISSVERLPRGLVTLALFASDTATSRPGLGAGLATRCRCGLPGGRRPRRWPRPTREPKLGVVFAEGFVERSPGHPRRHGPRPARGRGPRRRRIRPARSRDAGPDLPVLRRPGRRRRRRAPAVLGTGRLLGRRRDGLAADRSAGDRDRARSAAWSTRSTAGPRSSSSPATSTYTGPASFG